MSVWKSHEKLIFASFKIFPSEIIFVKHLEVYSLHYARAAHRIFKVVLGFPVLKHCFFLCFCTCTFKHQHHLTRTSISVLCNTQLYY